MKRKNKLPQNFDTKVLTINHIGSKGEGVSYLYTEFDYKEKEHHFFIPFSLPNEIIIANIGTLKNIKVGNSIKFPTQF